MEKHKAPRVVGFNILEDQCIWAKAGIVTFKRCNNAYDCNSCGYDKAMFLATNRDGGVRKPSLSEALRKLPSNRRQCRHMMTGRVENKYCDNNYGCEACEFDQMLDYTDDAHPAGEVLLAEFLGYRYSDSYYYHDGHTWARVESGGRVRVGVDEFAMKLFGRPDRWNCPEIGKNLMKGKRAFRLEREGNRADFLSPVDGTVIAVNQAVMKRPALTHANPYSEGWLVLVEPKDLKKAVSGLRSGSETKGWLMSEAQRLHDLASSEYGRLAATGASPVDDVFGELPEIGWQSLVREFLESGVID